MINMALLILDYMPWAVIAFIGKYHRSKRSVLYPEAGKFIIALTLQSPQFTIQLILLAVNGLNPMTYVKKSYATMLMAFTSF